MGCSFCLASEITRRGRFTTELSKLPDFELSLRKLEISCEIYFGQAFSGGALLWVW